MPAVMFTGLIQAVGTLHRRGNGVVVGGCGAFAPLAIGDSISVDGVCLTVAALVGDGFFANVSEETIRRTTLGVTADVRGVVNLEPALRLSDRLGGHLVSGHIDGLGKVVSLEELPLSWHLEIQWQSSSFSRFVCEKASIALNGISLTVADCSESGDKFSIAIIPHTWQITSLKSLCEGDLVNLEVDLMAKYAENLLRNTSSTLFEENPSAENQINKDWLASHGWS